MKFGKGWQKRHVHYGDQVGEYAHFPGKKAESAVYPLAPGKSRTHHFKITVGK